MDTISSREPGSSPLPMVGVIAGLLALVLSIVALVKVSSANKALTEQQDSVAQINAIKKTADDAAAAADKTGKNLTALATNTQNVLDQVGQMIGDIKNDVSKLQSTQSSPAAAASGSGGPVVAGPDEYVIKSGDTFSRIARAQGVTLADLLAVNSGLDPTHLMVGQKIKLPQKKPTQTQPAQKQP